MAKKAKGDDKKKASGGGTVYKRPDGKYQTQVTVGTKPDGKPNRVTITAATEREAEVKRMQLLADHS